MNTSIKYLKDETGNIISPVVSVDSVFDVQDGNNIGLKKFIVDLIFPIGSLYITTQDQHPVHLFTYGLWKQLEDVFLLASGELHTKLGDTGGEAEHTLTMDEMPKHNHQGSAKGLNTITTSYVSQDNGVIATGYIGYTWDTGNDQPHNNMPPYQVVAVWERIA